MEPLKIPEQAINALYADVFSRARIAERVRGIALPVVVAELHRLATVLDDDRLDHRADELEAS